MLRFVLLTLLGLHLGSGGPLCNKNNIDDIAAPKFDKGDNLSYDNCGKTKNGGNGKWYVAIGAEGGRWCFGLLLSNRTVITANCREEADDFEKDKSKFKAKFGGCYKKIVEPSSSTPCNSQDEEVSIAKVTSLKDLIKNTDIHMWELAKNVAPSFTPICLFNEGSKAVNTRYQVCDRKVLEFWPHGTPHIDFLLQWADCKDVSHEGTISDANTAEKNELCVKMQPLIDEDFTLDFLITKKNDRSFLRGFFYWDLDNYHVSYVDLLPFMRQIVHASYGLLHIMPEIPPKHEPKISVTDIIGVNDVECGKNKILRRRRRDLLHVPEDNIYKGNATRIEQFPWHVYLQIVGVGACGGSIISKNVILTAAHCAQDKAGNKHSIVAKLGLTNRKDTAEFEFTPRKMVVHPSYRGTAKGHDAALLFFSETFTFSVKVRPVCLWDLDDDDAVITGNLGYIVGWGVTENKESPDHLQSAQVPLVKYEECYHRYTDFYSSYLKPRQTLCVAGNGPNACKGDSGGGFVTKKNDGKWYIRGLSSFGLGPSKDSQTPSEVCSAQYPSLFESVVGIMGWIKEEIAKNAS